MSSNISITRICQHCSQSFTAKTTVTKFCSDKCAKAAYKVKKRNEKIQKSKTETEKIQNKPIENVAKKDFLTVNDVALLLNSCKQTVYNLIDKGVIHAVKISERKTLIRRSDIDKLFDLPQVQDEPTPKEESIKYSILECYTLSEVKELYHISDKALHNLIKRNQIPKMKEGILTYVPKTLIDNIFKPQ